MRKLFLLFIAALTLAACGDKNEPTIDNNGTLNGQFSVSATKKIRFSKGNLQYVGTLQFAESQWETFGDSQSDNHRDLFGWGTGDNPRKTSSNVGDYDTYNEWGENPIKNGGNKANMWRTLTKEEWVYLFHGRKNAAILFGMGSVNGVNGIIVLPDNWTTPKGISFTASTTEGLYWSDTYYTSSSNNYLHNAYTQKQWEDIMEPAGAVFLPAAGSRNGTSVSQVGSYGLYWSATECGSSNAYSCCFIAQGLYPQDDGYRNRGLSVRLVR